MQATSSSLSQPLGTPRSSQLPEPARSRYALHIALSPNAVPPVFIKHTYALLVSAIRLLAQDESSCRSYDCLYHIVHTRLPQPRTPYPKPFTREARFQEYAGRQEHPVCITNWIEKPETGVVTCGEVNSSRAKQDELGYLVPALNAALVESYEATFHSTDPSTQVLNRRAILGIMLCLTLYRELAHTWLKHLLRHVMSADELQQWKEPDMGDTFGGNAGEQIETLLFRGAMAFQFQAREDNEKPDRFDRINTMWFKHTADTPYYGPASDDVLRLYRTLAGLDTANQLGGIIDQFVKSIVRGGMVVLPTKEIAMARPKVKQETPLVYPIGCGTHTIN
ncbi:hypothetical protein MIND_01398000 [Mycena indigotica]|uniref:Uncharacterized protein n=1 Tax=Mycena indigotica TaxID=2126181 RepID=A0A8H6RYS7_9AGAR|nr:uncharacterized protein MIND_01398000 [Mycena indigotica]KAF7289357.1 hypothetical protein MIND_01398000 [Mycena indigotica]